MIQFKSPIKQHSGLRVAVSQSFGVNPQFYSKFKDDYGNPLIGHNGVDLKLGYDPRQSYGTDINFICEGKVIQTVWDNPMSTKGNGVYQDSLEWVGVDNKLRFLKIAYWHFMDVDVKVGQDVTPENNAGDMGNSGIVFPEPNPSQPYVGTHLHLGVYPYISENGIWKKEFPNNGYDGAVDPLQFIIDLNPSDWVKKRDILEWIGELLEPIKWFINKIKEAINSLK